MRQRWWGATGRRVPEIAVEGDSAVPLEEALVLEDVTDTKQLREAHQQGKPVVIRTDTAEGVLAALARPEVAAVVVPETKKDLLDLDLTKLTYG